MRFGIRLRKEMGPFLHWIMHSEKHWRKTFPSSKEVRLVDFTVRILESNLGTDAITRVHVESTDGEKTWGTVGVSDNVITASWEALVDSVSHKIQMESS